MNNFKKYDSLENHTNDKFLTVVQNFIDKPNMQWYATEKIHGTNFSVIISPDGTITPAKRSGVILEAEKFFNYMNIMQKYNESFKSILDLAKGTNTIFQIFGEYAGHGIQKEVDYGEQDFYVFDIAINGIYASEATVREFATDFGLKLVPLVKVGPLKELLELPVEFKSLVNPDAEGNNIGEGLVIKPSETQYLTNGKRAAIKYKTDKFKEKNKSQKPKIEVPLSEKDEEILSKLNEFNTVNRISNVISHIGQVTSKDFGKVLGLTLKDIFEEAGREGIDIMEADSANKVKKELQRLVQNTIRSCWINFLGE